MKMKTIQVFTIACAALTAVTAAVAQDPSPAADGQVQEGRRDSQWRAQVGWVHQWNRKMTVSSTDASMSVSELGGRRLLPSMPALTYPDNGAFIPRTFDDGYVHPDYWTGDRTLLEGPNPERFGTTWNWGAYRPSQYNYDGGRHPTLTFNIDRGDAVLEGTAIVTGSSATREDGLPVDGIELKLSRLLHAWVKNGDDAGLNKEDTALNMDMVFRLAWFPKDEQRFQRSDSQRVLAVSETYTYYDYYGASHPPLTIPYSGTYGTATDAGPLVPVTPESVRQISRFMGTVNDSIAIRSEVWRLRGAAGLEFVAPLTKRLRLFVSPQVVLEVVRMDVVRTENITFTSGESGPTTVVAERADRESRTQVVPGFLLSAGADYDFTENWFLSAGFGYEWLTENPSVRVGPSRVRFDLEGGEFNLSVGRWF